MVYKYTSPSNKSYIGQTKNLRKRKNTHIHTDGCRLFSRAIKKYGFENLKLEILSENLTIEEANYQEELLISSHNTLSPNGYNLKNGGNNSSPCNETRKRMSIAHTGRKMTEETKIKLSKALTGIIRPPMSDYTKLKLSISKSGENHPAFGLKGKLSHSSKTFKITEPDGNVVIVKGLLNYCNERGLTNTNMFQVALGRRTHHKKYKCEYIDE